MIQSPSDLAELLRAAIRVAADGESAPDDRVVVAAFVAPARAVFDVRTVEGRTYRVTVEERDES